MSSIDRVLDGLEYVYGTKKRPHALHDVWRRHGMYEEYEDGDHHPTWFKETFGATWRQEWDQAEECLSRIYNYDTDNDEMGTTFVVIDIFE